MRQVAAWCCWLREAEFPHAAWQPALRFAACDRRAAPRRGRAAAARSPAAPHGWGQAGFRPNYFKVSTKTIPPLTVAQTRSVPPTTVRPFSRQQTTSSRTCQLVKRRGRLRDGSETAALKRDSGLEDRSAGLAPRTGPGMGRQRSLARQPGRQRPTARLLAWVLLAVGAAATVARAAAAADAVALTTPVPTVVSPGTIAFVTQAGGACPPGTQTPAKCVTFAEAIRDARVGKIVLLEDVELRQADWAYSPR